MLEDTQRSKPVYIEAALICKEVRVPSLPNEFINISSVSKVWGKDRATRRECLSVGLLKALFDCSRKGERKSLS